MKADFTRTGRRTFKGILHDGVKAMERYYRNNFADGARQDSIDLLLGNYCVKPGEGVSVPCPLSTNKVSPENLALLALLVAGCTVLLVALCIPATRIVVWTQVYYWIAWCLVLLYGGILFRARGTEFVDNPELIKPLKGRLVKMHTGPPIQRMCSRAILMWTCSSRQCVRNINATLGVTRGIARQAPSG